MSPGREGIQGTHLSAAGRRQMEEKITARVKAQVELSIAEIANQFPETHVDQCH